MSIADTRFKEPALLSTSRCNDVSWTTLYWVVGAVLIAVTGLNFHLPAFDNGLLQLEDRELGWRLLEPFNLARENNVAAWWSGISLLVAGLVAFQQVDGRGKITPDACLIFSVLLIGLSCDEIGSLHERVGSLRDLLPYGVVCLGLSIYALSRVSLTPESSSLASTLLLGLVLLVSVALQEFLEHAIQWPGWSVGLRFAVEEGTELLGIYFILRTFVSSEHGTHRVPWHTMLPRASRFPWLWQVASLGLVLHVFGTVFFLAGFEDLETRGNTAAWYPCAVYLLLALVQHERNQCSPLSRGCGRVVFAWLVLCSLDAVAAFSQYVPKLAADLAQYVPLRLFPTTGVGRYLVHVGVILIVLWSAQNLPMRGLRIMAAVAVSLAAIAACFLEPIAAQLAMPGIIVYGLAVFWLWQPDDRQDVSVTTVL